MGSSKTGEMTININSRQYTLPFEYEKVGFSNATNEEIAADIKFNNTSIPTTVEWQNQGYPLFCRDAATLRTYADFDLSTKDIYYLAIPYNYLANDLYNYWDYGVHTYIFAIPKGERLAFTAQNENYLLAYFNASTSGGYNSYYSNCNYNYSTYRGNWRIDGHMTYDSTIPWSNVDGTWHYFDTIGENDRLILNLATTWGKILYTNIPQFANSAAARAYVSTGDLTDCLNPFEDSWLVGVDRAGTYTLNTKGTYVDKDILFEISAGSVDTRAIDPGDGFAENTSATLTSGGYLVIKEGFLPNTKISLATLIPDSYQDIPFATGNKMLPNNMAWDKNGQAIVGSMKVYDGEFT